ncbi:hypothetical protein IGI04_009528, partial [Brassica rapa subsp. trilocularis]
AVSSDCCHKGLAFFWEAHDVKKGDEPMGVDMVLVEDKVFRIPIAISRNLFFSKIICILYMVSFHGCSLRLIIHSMSVHRLNTLLREGSVSEKKKIFSKLVSHMRARLSLETFLGLIAALWRDLLDSFIPTEIDMLSQFRHMHLLPLIGYCNEEHQDDHGEICVGAARGDHYLHTVSARAIIHRDLKSDK